MSEQSSQLFRRTVPSGGSTLLARFVVDGDGTADSGDAPGIPVDLRAACEVSSLRLVFEAAASGPFLVPGSGSGSGEPGEDIEGVSSRTADVVIETSRDHETWTAAHRTATGTRGVVDIALDRPVTARWVRLTVAPRTPADPPRLNSLQVYGSCPTPRPPVTGRADRTGAGTPSGAAPAPPHCAAAVEARLGTATGLDDFSRKAQFVTYESHRAMFEARNTRLRLRDEASGPVPGMPRPALSSALWQIHEAVDGDGAYYGARKGCEPVHVQADPVSGRVIAVNRTTRPITNATLTAHYYDLDGRRLVPEQRKRVNVGPSATSSVFTADRMDSLPSFHLLRLLLEDPLGQVLSENTYWRYREARDMRSLNTARQTRVSAELGAPGENDGRRTLTASLRNQGTAVAAMVRLSLLDAETGARVLPTLYSDNYLWLLPGESRTVSLSWPPSALPAAHRPKLRLDGYNVPRAFAP